MGFYIMCLFSVCYSNVIENVALSDPAGPFTVNRTAIFETTPYTKPYASGCQVPFYLFSKNF